MSEGERMLTEDEVIEMTGLSASTIRRREREGSFPLRRKLSARRRGWLFSEVESWLRSLPPAEVEA